MREIVYILGFDAQFTENGAIFIRYINGKPTKVECEQQKGWFHGFFNDADGDIVAVIEDVNGRCFTISPHRMKFVNSPTKYEPNFVLYHIKCGYVYNVVKSSETGIFSAVDYTKDVNRAFVFSGDLKKNPLVKELFDNHVCMQVAREANI